MDPARPVPPPRAAEHPPRALGVPVRRVANWLNLSTPLGLAVAALGGARVRPGPHGLVLAEGYRLRFPVAGAFTVGDVIVTASTFDALQRRTPGVLGHELRHAQQYAVAGVWFGPGYLLASAWSLARTGDTALRNVFERHAGLVTGGYVHPVTGDPLGRPWRWGLRRASGRRGGARSDSPAGAAADGGAA